MSAGLNLETPNIILIGTNHIRVAPQIEVAGKILYIRPLITFIDSFAFPNVYNLNYRIVKWICKNVILSILKLLDESEDE